MNLYRVPSIVAGTVLLLGFASVAHASDQHDPNYWIGTQDWQESQERSAESQSSSPTDPSSEPSAPDDSGAETSESDTSTSTETDAI